MDPATLVVEQGHAASALLGPDGRLVYASPQLQWVLPEPAVSGLEGLLASALVHPDDIDVARRLLDALQPGSAGRVATVRVRRNDGAYLHCRVSGRRAAEEPSLVVLDVLPEEGRQSVVSALLHERRVSAAVASLVGPDDRLLRPLLHELRTPVTVVMGAADLLVEHSSDLTGEQSDDLVRSLHEHAHRLATSVEALDMTSLLRKELLDRDAVDAERLVQDAVHDCYAPDADVVRLDVPAGTHVVVDGAMVREALRALLSNVVVHAPAGTSVAVSVRASAAGCEFVVDDDGPGIPERLWDELLAPPFLRADGSSDVAGLGLPLVARIAAAHGGVAEVAASPSGGTRVVLVLPRERHGGDAHGAGPAG